MRIKWQFCYLRWSQGGKSATRFSIFQMRWLHGNGNLFWKTSSQDNLSNEYNGMFFFSFLFSSALENDLVSTHVPCFPGNSHLEWKTDHMTCFPLIKCSEKNKMDNSQNGYSSVEKTGKIKKMICSFGITMKKKPEQIRK